MSWIGRIKSELMTRSIMIITSIYTRHTELIAHDNLKPKMKRGKNRCSFQKNLEIISEWRYPCPNNDHYQKIRILQVTTYMHCANVTTQLFRNSPAPHLTLDSYVITPCQGHSPSWDSEPPIILGSGAAPAAGMRGMLPPAAIRPSTVRSGAVCVPQSGSSVNDNIPGITLYEK